MMNLYIYNLLIDICKYNVCIISHLVMNLWKRVTWNQYIEIKRNQMNCFLFYFWKRLKIDEPDVERGPRRSYRSNDKAYEIRFLE